VVALALVGGLAAWNTHLVAQVARAERARALEGEVIATVTQPQSQVVPLTASGTDVAGSKVVAAFVRKSRMLTCRQLPLTPCTTSGSSTEGPTRAGGVPPDAGTVYVRRETDPARWTPWW
jgi:hypothetical protein